MNDPSNPDPNPSPNPNGIDSLLEAAFAGRPRRTTARPSLLDVQRRARRYRQRRTAAAVGALAVTGVGGVAVLTHRSSAIDDVATGSPNDATTTTMSCFFVDNTTLFSTTTSSTTTSTYEMLLPSSTVLEIAGIVTVPTWVVNPDGSYVVIEGDYPALVAQRFGVTVEELNAANAGTPGYDAFSVDLVILIPSPTSSTTTTMYPNVDPNYVDGAPCAPNPQPPAFRCSGEAQSADDGWSYFGYCELVGASTTTTTIATTTTSLG